MHFFEASHKLPPLFKCVQCGNRPAEVYHHHIPLCRRCSLTLQRQIDRHGGAIVAGVAKLKLMVPDSADDMEALIEQLLQHVDALLPYEDNKLKTTDPDPSALVHLLRAREFVNLDVRLCNDGDDQGKENV